jgi:hypothetical protein
MFNFYKKVELLELELVNPTANVLAVISLAELFAKAVE